MLQLSIALGLITIGTSIISGVVGMAGGIVLLSSMTFFMPLDHVIPIHGIVQLVSNGSRGLFLRKKIVKDIALHFMLGSPFGAYGAYLFLSHVQGAYWFYIPLLLLISYTLFKPDKLPAISIPTRGFFFLGILAGFLGPLIGATGPLLAPFFLRDDLSKEEIVATKAFAQIFTHIVKIPLFLGLSFAYEDYTLVIVLMVLGALLGTKIGVFLLNKSSERVFRVIYKSALGLAGLRILWKLVQVV